MSVEYIGLAEATPVAPASGPSTGSWSTHRTGDALGAFPDMDADADLDRISCVESLCMNCHEQGMTRLLLTRIPYFREIVVMSFACPHCYARSAEVQPANDLEERACKVAMRVLGPEDPAATKADLNRQVIKSETGRIEIPELVFEIPPNNKRGDINTVEGVLTNIADSLAADQANRALAEPETAEKLDYVIEQFRRYARGEAPFTFILDDLAGNSFLENPSAPSKDTDRVQVTFYPRTREQTLELGYAVEENKSEMEAREVLQGQEAAKKLKELFPNGPPPPATTVGAAVASTRRGIQVAPHAMATLDTYFNVNDRSAIMTGPCTGCDNPEAETRMCVTDVPHFKDVVLLVTQCDQCGYRDAEVKPMGRVSEKGRRITLRVTSVEDMARDLLKSDTASCRIPELDLDLEAGTLGGKYTTLEGLVEDIVGQLSRVNPFAFGDSSQPDQKGKMADFMRRLEALPTVAQPWTFILDCPLGNCFIYSPLGEADPHLTVERYTRTFDQDEELGLNDMNVDHYMTAEQQKEFDQETVDEEAQKEIEQAMEQATMNADGTPAAASSSSSSSSAGVAAASAAAAAGERMVELKQSKIGGNISVEHEMDMEGATGNVAPSKEKETEKKE